MQNTSAFWKSLAAADGTHVECRAIINNVEYTGIEPPVITRSTMQSGVEIGNVVSAICTFVLDTGNTVPKSAEVKIETRLVGGTDDEPVYSEWLPQGTFYISKRMFDQTTNTQNFECYDALLKANAVWEPASSTWPQQTEDILDELLTIIGLQLDSRTSIVSYAISKPNDGATIRDVLSIIAQHNGGNWIVTPDNKLRLVPIVDLNESDSADTIVDIDAVIGDYYTGEVKTISGVQFTVENETAIIGDETGVVVNVTIPGIIAGDVAEAIIGKTYRPFTFGSAFYDIAAELGDYIQCDDVVSVIYSEVVTLGASLHGDISAPDIAELDDEYPYVGASAKALQTAKTYAQIAAETAKNEAISAAAAQLASAVVNINSDIDDLQSQIDGNITTWFYAVDPTMSNPPAVDWDTDDEKNNHLGDLYYNTESGYCWRFMRSGDQYSWQRISDTDITTALANAQRAQATADNKRRVFVVQPIPPYDVGDLWMQGNSGDILRCTNAKATGEAYAAADWELASKYTDDSAVTALDNALNQQEVFNRLTDSGAAQGLVLYNGQLYINASYINAGRLNVGRVDFNEPDHYYDVPDENDPDSLLSGQTVTDGWIVNTSGSGVITVFSCGFAIPLRGKTVTVTFRFNGTLNGGLDSWTSISAKAQSMGNINNWTFPSGRTPSNPYTYTVVVPDNAMTFSIAMTCAGVKQIEVSLDSPVVPSESIVYNYEGQRIGGASPFRVYRDGTLITFAKSIFNGVARISRLYLDVPLDVDSGGTGATNAAGARTKLEITPANIGAVNKAGDEMTGNLMVRKSGESNVSAYNSDTGTRVYIHAPSNGRHGVFSNGYYNGTDFVSSSIWMIVRNTDGKVAVADHYNKDQVNQKIAQATASIGTHDTSNLQTVSVSAGTFVNVASVNLPAGIYIVTGRISFGTDATGRNIAFLTTDNNATNNNATNSTAGNGRSTLEITARVGLNAAGTVYLKTYKATGTGNVDAYIDAIRLM